MFLNVRIHQIVGNAMYLNDNKPLPPNQADINQLEEFINYFHDKIKHIPSTLEEDDNQERYLYKNCHFFKLNLMI